MLYHPPSPKSLVLSSTLRQTCKTCAIFNSLVPTYLSFCLSLFTQQFFQKSQCLWLNQRQSTQTPRVCNQKQKSACFSLPLTLTLCDPRLCVRCPSASFSAVSVSLCPTQCPCPFPLSPCSCFCLLLHAHGVSETNSVSQISPSIGRKFYLSNLGPTSPMLQLTKIENRSTPCFYAFESWSIVPWEGIEHFSKNTSISELNMS